MEKPPSCIQEEGTLHREYACCVCGKRRSPPFREWYLNTASLSAHCAKPTSQWFCSFYTLLFFISRWQSRAGRVNQASRAHIFWTAATHYNQFNPLTLLKIHMTVWGRRLGHTWSLVRRWWEPSRPQLTCACCPFPRAHCPPHPRSDCSVLRLPFAVLFCKGRRGHGRGGWHRPKPRGDKTKDRTENTESEPGRVAVRKGMAHGKGNKNRVSTEWQTGDTQMGLSEAKCDHR